jgi:hypothetical protein
MTSWSKNIPTLGDGQCPQDKNNGKKKKIVAFPRWSTYELSGHPLLLMWRLRESDLLNDLSQFRQRCMVGLGKCCVS